MTSFPTNLKHSEHVSGGTNLSRVSVKPLLSNREGSAFGQTSTAQNEPDQVGGQDGARRQWMTERRTLRTNGKTVASRGAAQSDRVTFLTCSPEAMSSETWRPGGFRVS
jgi:hypothetical protein